MVYAHLLSETRAQEGPNYDFLNLRGRLELVNLNQPARGPNSAIGDLLRCDQKVLVTNGHRFLGKTCLVRFDLEHKLSHPDIETLHKQDGARFREDDEVYPLRANFISTNVPFRFKERVEIGINPEDYILYGRLKGPVPSFAKVNHYYDPGKMGIFAYIRGYGEDQKIYVVSSDGIISIESYHGVSKLLPRPNSRSRVVLAESKRKIRELIGEIIDEGIVPVRMTPFINHL